MWGAEGNGAAGAARALAAAQPSLLSTPHSCYHSRLHNGERVRLAPSKYAATDQTRSLIETPPIRCPTLLFPVQTTEVPSNSWEAPPRNGLRADLMPLDCQLLPASAGAIRFLISPPTHTESPAT